jgi:hypothetical protein
MPTVMIYGGDGPNKVIRSEGVTLMNRRIVVLTKKKTRVWGVSSVVEHVFSMCEALVQSPMPK